MAAEAQLLLRRLRQDYPGVLPSAILAEDAGLLLHQLDLDVIVDEAERDAAAQRRARAEREGGARDDGVIDELDLLHLM